MNKCPAPSCGKEIAYDQFACKPHWLSLPQPIRDRIWSAWRARLRDPGNPSVVTEHMAAKRAAMKYLRPRRVLA